VASVDVALELLNSGARKVELPATLPDVELQAVRTGPAFTRRVHSLTFPTSRTHTQSHAGNVSFETLGFLVQRRPRAALVLSQVPRDRLTLVLQPGSDGKFDVDSVKAASKLAANIVVSRVWSTVLHTHTRSHTATRAPKPSRPLFMN